MTRIYLGRDEWWPIPDPQPVEYGDLESIIEVPQDFLDRYTAAVIEFNLAAAALIRAAADAGDKYWQDNT